MSSASSATIRSTEAMETARLEGRLVLELGDITGESETKPWLMLGTDQLLENGVCRYCGYKNK